MQCRQALRKRAITSAAIAHSTGPPQALWITDDLLNEAFARFVRVSKTGRRHGSTIPGPLEAQRRQSRRRMGLTTAENGQFGSLVDFGALYGAVPYATSETYSYHPPSPNTLSQQSPLTNLFSASYELTEPPQQAVSTEKEIVEEVEPQKITQLLPKIRPGVRVTAAMLQPILQRLEANEGHATLLDLRELRTALKKNQLSPDALDVLFGVFVTQYSAKKLSISDLLKISDILFTFAKERANAHTETWQLLVLKFRTPILRDDAMAESFASLFTHHATTSFGDPKRYEWHAARLQLLSNILAQYARASVSSALYVTHISQLLYWLVEEALKADLPKAETRTFVVAVAEVLRERNTTEVLRATTSRFLPDQHDSISFWLRCVRASGAFHRFLEEEKLFSNLCIYHDVGKHCTPRQLSTYLDSLIYRDLSVLLFTAWGKAQPLQQEAGQENLNHTQIVSAATTQTGASELFGMEDRKAIKNIYLKGVLPNVETAELLSAYVAGSHDVEALRNSVTNTQALLVYYRALCKAPASIKVTALQQEAIQHLLDIDKPRLALRLFCVSPGVFVKDVPGLVDHLAHAWRDTGQILQLVGRNLALRRDHQALLQRRMSAPTRQRLPDNVGDLISHLGVHTAFSTHFNARTTWDRAWLCYQFLGERGVDISKSPEIAKQRSKAFFYAGAVRPLRDGVRLPNARLKHVLQTVRVSETLETVLALKQLVVSERAKQTVKLPAIELLGTLNRGERYRNIQRRQRSVKVKASSRSHASLL